MSTRLARCVPAPVLVVVLLASGGLPGQAAPRLDALIAAFRKGVQNTSRPNLRRMEGLLREVAVLPYRDDVRSRKRAERFLQGVAGEARGPEGAYLRITAVQALGRVAHSREAASFLVALAAAAGDRRGTLAHWVGLAMGDLDSPEAVDQLCSAGLDHDAAPVRRVVLDGLSELSHPLVLDAASRHAGRILEALDATRPRIAAAAARAAGNLGLTAAVPRLLELARHEDLLVRKGVARGLGAFGREDGVMGCLHELLRDPEPRVREAAAAALGRTGCEEACAFLVERLGRDPLRVELEVLGSLRRLAGQDLGLDPGAWRAWWRRYRRTGGEGFSGERARPGSRGRYASTYYGVPVGSDRVVFVLDISMSMRMRRHPGGPRRIELAREELAKTIEDLPPEARFNVVAFSTGHVCLQGRGLLEATPGNKRRARRWVRGLVPAGGTNSYGALKAALLRFPGADTLFFLSDGRPSRGPVTEPDRILARVASLNLRRGVRINTVALLTEDHTVERGLQGEEEDPCARFMRHLAEITGATFVARDK